MPAPGSLRQTVTWVYADDLDAACSFYSRLLGLEQIRDQRSARIYRVSGSACIGVCRATGGRVVEPEGTMITLVTDEVDRWYAHLNASGAVTRGRPKEVEEFGIYAFAAEDPNGYVIEFQTFLEPD